MLKESHELQGTPMVSSYPNGILHSKHRNVSNWGMKVENSLKCYSRQAGTPPWGYLRLGYGPIEAGCGLGRQIIEWFLEGSMSRN